MAHNLFFLNTHTTELRLLQRPDCSTSCSSSRSRSRHQSRQRTETGAPNGVPPPPTVMTTHIRISTFIDCKFVFCRHKRKQESNNEINVDYFLMQVNAYKDQTNSANGCAVKSLGMLLRSTAAEW